MQAHEDEITVGLINWGGMTAHSGEERGLVCPKSKFQVAATKDSGATGSMEAIG